MNVQYIPLLSIAYGTYYIVYYPCPDIWTQRSKVVLVLTQKTLLAVARLCDSSYVVPFKQLVFSGFGKIRPIFVIILLIHPRILLRYQRMLLKDLK